MELNQYAITSIPIGIKDFKLMNGSCCVAYKHSNDFLYSFVHFGDNTIEEKILDYVEEICLENINGIKKNYICFYSPQYNQALLNLEHYENFVFIHTPLIAFGQIPFHIDIDNLPSVDTSFKKNYACLINRVRHDRLRLFTYLQDNNLVNKGYVSYRNVNHSYFQNNDNAKIQKSFINFEDKLYPDNFDYESVPLSMVGYPRQFIWFYPVDNFLFDFAIETHNFPTPFLTEKSIKGFFWGKIPVVTGSRNLMAYLEQFGFDIFRDIIDYRYDIQKEQYMRMDMYLEQVKKLATIDISSIHNLARRLEYNKNLICNLVIRSQEVLEQITADANYISNNKKYFLGY